MCIITFLPQKQNLWKSTTPTTKKENMKASAQSEELAPRSLREIVQKKILDEVIGTTGNWRLSCYNVIYSSKNHQSNQFFRL